MVGVAGAKGEQMARAPRPTRSMGAHAPQRRSRLGRALLVLVALVAAAVGAQVSPLAASADPPPIEAHDDVYSTPFNTGLTRTFSLGVLGNDVGEGLEVVASTQASHGTVSVSPDGGFTYTPTAGFSGSDSFGYTAQDSSSQQSSATATVIVDPPPPVATGDSYTLSAGTSTSISAPGVLANDTGSDLHVTQYDAVQHGLVTMANDGSFDYTPDQGFTGTDGFGYTVTDLAGQTTSALVTLNVVAASAAPAAFNDFYSTPHQTVLTVTAANGVLKNDTGTGITVDGYSGPNHGTVTVGTNGAISYRPHDGFSGPDSFIYHIKDNVGRRADGIANVRVGPACPTMCITGRVLDRTNGAGIAGITVRAFQGASPGPEVLSDANGKYTLKVLVPNTPYRVVFTDLQSPPRFQTAAHPADGPTATVPSGSSKLIDRLRPYGNITGRAVDKITGKGISGVEIWVWQDGTLKQTATTGANGRFVVSRLLDSGRYQVQLRDRRNPALYRRTWYDGADLASGAKPVRVGTDIVVKALHT
ncbi:MAG: hypothetical protein JWM05_1814 [Acidimicrobiales bacterium]|nr:hypothetical protein [Acidimicrobiales bacterium]